MIQEILKSLIKDDFEEAKRLVNEFVVENFKENTIGYHVTLMATNALLSCIEGANQTLDCIKQEENKFEEKVLKSSFITRWYYSRYLQRIKRCKLDIEMDCHASRWVLIKFLTELKEESNNNKNKEETKKE